MLPQCEICEKEDAIALILRKQGKIDSKIELKQKILPNGTYVFYTKHKFKVFFDDDLFHIGLRCMQKLSGHRFRFRFSMRYAKVKDLLAILESI